MKQERMLTAQELLKYGFISKINNYSTNKKTEKMEKFKELFQKVDNLFNEMKNFVGGTELINYDFTAEDGTVLFQMSSLFTVCYTRF